MQDDLLTFFSKKVSRRRPTPSQSISLLRNSLRKPISPDAVIYCESRESCLSDFLHRILPWKRKAREHS